MTQADKPAHSQLQRTLPFQSPWAVIWARRWWRLVAIVAIVVLAATAIVIAAAEAQRLARSLHHDCLTKTKKMLASHPPLLYPWG